MRPKKYTKGIASEFNDDHEVYIIISKVPGEPGDEACNAFCSRFVSSITSVKVQE